MFARLVSPVGRRNIGSLIVTEVKNNIGVITLNDPKRLNALTESMGLEFADAVNAMNAVRMCVT